MYFGSIQEGLELLTPFANLPNIFAKNRTFGWDELYDVVLLGSDPATCLSGTVHTPYAASLKSLDVGAMVRAAQGMGRLMEKYPGTRLSTFSIHSFNTDYVMAIDPDTTAYPWRDTVAQA
jgi:hypothetical protein